MDQAGHPGRYSICNRVRGPDAAGASLEATYRRAPMRRGPARLGLSHGRLRVGSGGGPALCCLPKTPRRGVAEVNAVGMIRLRRPAAWAAETEGRRFEGRPLAALLFALTRARS